jgi:uncharacterized protein (TIRG00374 family)
VTNARVPLHHNRWVQLAVGLAVSAACLWWAMRGLLSNPESRAQTAEAFIRANYGTLPLIWIVIAAFYWLKAWRWKLLLKPVGDFHTLRDLVPPMMIGFAFNNLLPAHLGDFARAVIFARQTGMKATASLSTIVLERVFDIVAILLLLGCGLAFVPGLDPSVRNTALLFAALASVFVVLALIYVFWTKPFVGLVEGLLARLPLIPARLRTKLAGLLEAGADGLASLKHPRLLAGIFASSLGQWVLNGVMVYLALASFGVYVSPLVSCIVLGVTALAVAVPSSPGYVGVIQACFMSVLQLFTSDQANVFAASVYYHVAQFIPVTLIGLYYFRPTGLKFAEVEAAAEAEAETNLTDARNLEDDSTVGATPPKSEPSISTPASSVTRTE